MKVFQYAETVEEQFEAAGPVVIEPGLYTHPSGRKFYLVANDTDAVIVLEEGQSPRASNRWTRTNMAEAPADYFTFDDSDGLVISNDD